VLGAGCLPRAEQREAELEMCGGKKTKKEEKRKRKKENAD